MTRLLLVRHGQSEWNATGRWQGQADPPLTRLGEEQAQAAAARLGDVAGGPVDAVRTSDLQRASRTAEILADGLGVAAVVDARFRERHAGEWQGRTRAEIDEHFPGYLATGRRPPGWEDDAAFFERVIGGCTEVAAATPGTTVVVVTHGGVIHAVERHLELSEERLLPNLGGRVVEVEGGGFRAGERFVLVDHSTSTPRGQL